MRFSVLPISKISRRKLGTGRKQPGVEVFRSPRGHTLWQTATLELTYITGAIVTVTYEPAIAYVVTVPSSIERVVPSQDARLHVA